MRYKIITPPAIENAILKLHPLLKRKIRSALDNLAEDPHQGKPLTRELTGLYSFRVSRYRIVYRIRARCLEVFLVALGPRKTIYKSLV